MAVAAIAPATAADADSAARDRAIAAIFAMGGSLGDICGGEGDRGHAHCPDCIAQGDLPLDPRRETVDPACLVIGGAGLTRPSPTARDIDPTRPVRAPPAAFRS